MCWFGKNLASHNVSKSYLQKIILEFIEATIVPMKIKDSSSYGTLTMN